MPQTSRETRSKSLYSAHPGVVMVQKWMAELPEKTGRTLEEWIQLVKGSGPPTEKERREWLKQTFNLGTNTAWWISERAEGRGWEDGDPEAYLRAAEGYVEAMFAGPKAGLRPIYDQLLKLALKLGKDVKISPGKTIVPIYRHHVIAQIKPATRTRIDLSFALGRMKTPKRLIETGGLAKGDRLTHRIPISALAEIDDEVKHWLKVAYELDA